MRRTSRPIEIGQWVGPRRATIARATADHALELSRIDDVRPIVARVIRDEHCTVAELAAELEAGPRRGSALLRQVFGDPPSSVGSWR